MKQHILLLLLLIIAIPTAIAVPGRIVLPVDQGWEFFFRHENSSDNARSVTLPHTWNNDAAGGRSGLYLQTSATYQNTLFVPAEWSNKRLFLKFHGVQTVADLFVNGRHTGEHCGGGTAFTFEITDKIRFGDNNALRVDVSNAWRNDVLPTSSEMNLYGGIYRNVELIVTDKTAISPLYLGSDGVLIHPRSVTAERVEGEVEIHLTSLPSASVCTLTLEITTPDGYQTFIRSQKARTDGKPLMIPFSFEEPALWCPENPALYTLRVRVEGDGSCDEVCVRTGFRDIRVSPEGGFLLNGQRLNIRGVTMYHDNSGVGNAFRTTDYDADLNILHEVGANALRSALMPHAQYLYQQCDTQGLLAWVDLPLHHAPFMSDIAYVATTQFEENGRQQLREMVAQLINHPSVVMWGIFSCLRTTGDDVLPYVRSLNDLAHATDPSRPTVACSNRDGDLNFVTDLIVWQQDVGWEKGSTSDLKVWCEMMRKSWSNLRSGVAYGAEGIPAHRNPDARTALRATTFSERRQTRFHEEYTRYLGNDSLFWGVWINNLFDFGAARRASGINASGLMTHDRRDAKDAFYLYKTLWNRDVPTLHIVGKRRTLRDNPVQQFRIYAQESPMLLINGDTIAVREWAPCQYLSDSVILSGKCRVEASAGGVTDRADITVGNVLKPRLQQVPQKKVGLQQTN